MVNHPNRSRPHTLAFSAHELTIAAGALRVAVGVANEGGMPMLAARRRQLATRFNAAVREAAGGIHLCPPPANDTGVQKEP